MHFSETKHGLTTDSEWLTKHSKHLLDLDRLVAVTAFLCFAWQWLITEIPELTRSRVVIEMLAISMCSAAGELTKNRVLYVCLHLIWHAGVYHLAFLYA